MVWSKRGSPVCRKAVPKNRDGFGFDAGTCGFENSGGKPLFCYFSLGSGTACNTARSSPSQSSISIGPSMS